MNKSSRLPWIPVLAVAVATVFFALQLPKCILDNDVATFMPDSNPDKKAYVEVESKFGGQMILLIGLKNSYGSVFEPAFLVAVKDLSDKIAALPYTSSVSSVTNTDYIRAEGDRIVVSPLVEKNFTGSPDEIAELKGRILSWELYRRALVSDDYRSTQILVGIKGGYKDNGAAKGPPIDPKQVEYDAVKAIIDAAKLQNIEVYISGTPALAVLISKNMEADLVFLIPLVILVVAASLILSFRRFGGVALTLVTVLISAVWTMGLMGLLGVKLTMVSTVIPVLMVAVGSAYSIHVISHYYDEMRLLRALPPGEAHTALIMGVLGKIGLPVILAGLTTMAGFGSLAFTSILPIRFMGLFSAFGVLVALVVSLSLVPAVLILRGPGGARIGSTPGTEPEHDLVSSILLRFFMPFARHPRRTVAGTLVVLAISLFGLTRIQVDNSLVDYFRRDTEIVRADTFLRREFNGTKMFSIVVKGEKKGDLNKPEILNAMDGLASLLESDFPSVGKVISYTQFIKRINQVINADEPASGRSRAAAATAAPTGAVGDAEEPAFGFGFDSAPAAPVSASSAPTAPKLPAGIKVSPAAMSDTGIAELLGRAYSRAGRHNIGADELLTLVQRELNTNGAAYYEIPTDPERYGLSTAEELSNLIANYLLLISAGTSEWSDDPIEPSMARMTVQLNSTGNADSTAVTKAIKKYAAARFPKGYSVQIAGPAIIETSVANMIVNSQIWNIVSSMAAVFLILAVYYRSLAAGVMSIIPLSVTILFNFGLMGLFGVKLDVPTSMTASIAIGTGIDYTIHFLSAFHRFRKTGTDFQLLMEKSILGTGKAIMFNAVSVAAGFLVLAGSRFTPLVHLGILIALTMLTSSFASLTLMPALLQLFKPKFIERPLVFEKGGRREVRS